MCHEAGDLYDMTIIFVVQEYEHSIVVMNQSGRRKRWFIKACNNSSAGSFASGTLTCIIGSMVVENYKICSSTVSMCFLVVCIALLSVLHKAPSASWCVSCWDTASLM